jgi:hypothetical protein
MLISPLDGLVAGGALPQDPTVPVQVTRVDERVRLSAQLVTEVDAFAVCMRFAWREWASGA